MEQRRSGSEGRGESERDRFIERFSKDVTKGAVPPLRDYLRSFPDVECFVAEEYLAWITREKKARSRSSRVDGPERVVGSYRLLGELGRGGQAVVYKAIDTRLSHGRIVALRLLKAESLVTPQALLRFPPVSG